MGCDAHFLPKKVQYHEGKMQVNGIIDKKFYRFLIGAVI
jgi:hypothetical protein